MQKLEQQKYDQKAAEKKEAEKKALMASLLKNASNLNKAQAAEEESKKNIMSSEKIDIYKDPRDEKGIEIPDRTEIICKHFMEAVETDKYGFLWVCPNNGDNCQYRHCLPPGMVIIKDIPLEKPADDDMTLEERIEEERANLQSEGLTRVTKATFEEWKLRKREEEERKVEEARQEAAKKQGGKGLQVMSGRMLFKYDPTLFKDDDNAIDADMYEVQEEDETKEEEEAKVDTELFQQEAAQEEEPDFD